MAFIDLTGQKFGRWTVIKKVPNLKSRDSKFLCKCECGTEREVLGKNLRNGRSSSCGCYKKEIDTQRIIKLNKERALNLKGQKYGLLTPLEPTEKRLSNSIIWKCQCDCGNITYVSVDNLRGARPVRSCGCLGNSVGEKFIENILKENNIEYIKEYTNQTCRFEDTNALARFDFYLPKYNRLIEFDGEYHYIEKNRGESLEKRPEKDIYKNHWAKENNISLVRIPYWERDKITLDMMLRDQYLVDC